MKQRRKANQMQVMLFDEGPSSDPSLVEMPADRCLELEKAIAELLFKAAGKAEGRKGGGRDA